jgi:hypothetical protein
MRDAPERSFHNKFDHLRKHGEWFAPAPELLRFIHDLDA